MQAAPQLALLDLPDELLFRVLAASTPTPRPFKAKALLAVCTRFFRVLCAHATSLTLKRLAYFAPRPSPTVLALLCSAASVRHMDIRGCRGTWPLPQLLPHLPRLQCVDMDLHAAEIEQIPETLPQAHIQRVHISCQGELDLVARLQERLRGGTVVIDELHNKGFPQNRPPGQLISWYREDGRLPLIKRAALALENAPSGFWRLTSLAALQLSGGSAACATLPDAIGGFAQLRTLEILSFSDLATLPGALGGLSALTRLEVRQCRALETFPCEFAQLQSLEELVLRLLPKLSGLPPGLERLPAIKRICIADCGPESPPLMEGEAWNVPPSVTRLDFDGWRDGHCWLQSVAAPVASLRHLLLRCHAPPSIPTALYRLTSLQTLKLLADAEAHELDRLSALCSLQALELSLERIHGSCPPFYAHLPALTSLALTECDDVTEISGNLSPSLALQDLRIERMGRITFFPQGIATLTAIQSLNLAGAMFSQLPDSITGLTALTALRLSGCVRLRALPAGIGALSALQRLRLQRCQCLTALPASTCMITALQELDLQGCSELRALPDTLGALSALTKLALCDCHRLEALPNSVGELSALQELNVSHCYHLSNLPTTVCSLSALRRLDIACSLSLIMLPACIRNLPALVA